MSNESEGIEANPSVSELQATVDALRDELVDATERVRELEEATDGVTPGGSTGDTDATTGDTATGSVDPGSFDALADGSVDGSDDVTVADLGAGDDADDGGDDTSGVPGRDPTKHPQNTQDAELVDAGSSPSTRSSDDPDESTPNSRGAPDVTSSETTEEDAGDDDSDDIIVA
jgi:hypothetical protein